MYHSKPANSQIFFLCSAFGVLLNGYVPITFLDFYSEVTRNYFSFIKHGYLLFR